MSAKSAGLRALWICAVLAFFTCLLYNIARLSFVYIRGDVVMSWTPMTPRPDFPVVTICDTSAASFGAMQQLGFSPREYSHRIIKLIKNTKPAPDTESVQLLLSPTAYHEHLPTKKMQQLFQENMLVLKDSCKIYSPSESGSGSKVQMCNITQLQVPGYFSCNSLFVDPRASRVEFHALLDSSTDRLHCSKCIVGNVESFRTGAVVYLHEKDKYPIDISNGLRLSPGTQNFIHVKSENRALRRYCSNSAQKYMNIYYSQKYWNLQYNRDLCQHVHLHDLYVSRCNCTVNNFPLTSKQPTNSSSILPSCIAQQLSNITESQQLQLQSLHCMQRMGAKMRSHCPRPCRSLRFTVARSEAKAVDDNSVLDFFADYVANSSAFQHLSERLTAYSSALRLKFQGNVTEAAKLVKSSHYIQQNVITVILQFNPSSAKQLSENYILGLSAFVSQIGGLLSLFCGITVVCFAEIAEFACLIVCHVVHKLKR